LSFKGVCFFFSRIPARCYLFYSAAEIKMSAAGLIYIRTRRRLAFTVRLSQNFQRTPLEFSSRCAASLFRARIRPRNYFPVIYCTCSARLFNGAARTPSAEENIVIYGIWPSGHTHSQTVPCDASAIVCVECTGIITQRICEKGSFTECDAQES